MRGFQKVQDLNDHCTTHLEAKLPNRKHSNHTTGSSSKPNMLFENEKPRICQCGNGVVNSSNEKYSEQSENGKDFSYCSVCVKGFPELSGLHSHLMWIHGRETVHGKCFFCVRGFMKVQDLNVHCTTHEKRESFCLCDQVWGAMCKQHVARV